MKPRLPLFFLCAVTGLGLWAGTARAAPAPAAAAAQLPGPADVSRIKPTEQPLTPPPDQGQDFSAPASTSPTQPPKGADKVHLTLQHVEIEGNTVFTTEQLQDIYAPLIHKDVTLDAVYAMADAITKRYRSAGYFLSLAYVPKQHIHDGNIKIQVTEGYIGQVDIPEQLRGYVVQAYIDRLQTSKPATSIDVESFLLRINDLPGLSFRGVLSSLEGAGDGVVRLSLVPGEKKGVGSISYDNYSSRYLGPNEVSASYSTSLLPLQQTTVSGLTGLPDADLYYGTLDHAITIAPDIVLDMTGGITRAYPGYTLKEFDIRSRSVNAGFGLTYQWIRQRNENLSVKFSMDSQDVSSDILGTPLTRDHIRAARAGLNYDVGDGWNGHNAVALTLSQGIAGLGASRKDDLNISREGALPDFAKAALELSRLQGVTDDWSVFAAASGQAASGTLFSSEEFGYGGQAFGRAYDSSDITGDQGISGSFELRYGGLADLSPVALQPYLFGDTGVVWNTNRDFGGRASGTSAGFGLRFISEWQQTGNIGIAWPLTRDVSVPIYGGAPQGPRILIQIGQQF